MGVSNVFALFYVVYSSLVIFAALRIATALLIRDTMAAASKDQGLMVELELQSKQKYAEQLKAVFNMMDISGEGQVSYDELQAMCCDPKACAILELLDVQMSHVEQLYEILDDGVGGITFEEFLGGITRCKGQARAMDMCRS